MRQWRQITIYPLQLWSLSTKMSIVFWNSRSWSYFVGRVLYIIFIFLKLETCFMKTVRLRLQIFPTLNHIKSEKKNGHLPIFQEIYMDFLATLTRWLLGRLDDSVGRWLFFPFMNLPPSPCRLLQNTFAIMNSALKWLSLLTNSY